MESLISLDIKVRKKKKQFGEIQNVLRKCLVDELFVGGKTIELHWF